MSLFKKKAPAVYAHNWWVKGQRWYISRDGVKIGFVAKSDLKFVPEKPEFGRFAAEVTEFCRASGLKSSAETKGAAAVPSRIPAQVSTPTAPRPTPIVVAEHPAAFVPVVETFGRTAPLFTSNAPGASLVDSGLPSKNVQKGIEGEERMYAELQKLGNKEAWHVVNSIPILNMDRTVKHDIDHLVIGPGGVFCIDSKVRTGARVKVEGHKFTVFGGSTVKTLGRDLRGSSMNQARAISNLLSPNLGFPLACQAIVAFIDVASFESDAEDTFEDWVWVTTMDKVNKLLTKNHVIVNPVNVAKIYDEANRMKEANNAVKVLPQTPFAG